jgi:outer membrane protein assembly factor BamB
VARIFNPFARRVIKRIENPCYMVGGEVAFMETQNLFRWPSRSSAYRLDTGYMVCIACVLLFSSQIMGQEPDSPANNDWPRFLGPNIDGISPETGILKDWSDGKLKLLWQTELGEGYSMCSVADGSAYQFDKRGDRGRLRCIDVLSGEIQWEFDYESDYSDMYGYDAGPRSSPLIDGDRVYLFGVEGMLICVDRNTHKSIWRVDTAQKFGVVQNFFGVASAPVIHQDKLLVMVGGSPPESAQVPPGQLDRVEPNGSAVVAFDKFTGEVIYKTGDDLASYTSLTWMAVGQERLLVAWARDNLWGIEPGQGSVKFKFPYRSKKLESVNAMTPITVGDKIFLSECYENGSTLLQLKNGKLETLWNDAGKRKKSLQSHWCTPIVSGDFLYGCSGRNSGSAELRCIRISDGEVQWSQRGFGRCSMLLIDEHLVVVGERGRLALVKATPKQFELVTERLPDDQLKFVPNCWAAPVVADGRLFVRGGKKLACFQLVPVK